MGQAGEDGVAIAFRGGAARVRGGMLFVVRITAESGRACAALAPRREWWPAGDSTY